MKIYPFLTVIISCLIFITSVQAFCDTEPPETGNWTIDSLVLCNDAVIVVNGNMTIDEAGIFQGDNVTLIMNSSEYLDNASFIYNHGSIELRDSVIEEAGEKEYGFINYPGSYLVLEDNNISDCGFYFNKSNPYGSDIKEKGLYVASSNAEITGNIFKENNIPLIIVADASEINSNIFENNHRGPLFTADNVVFSGNDVFNNSLSVSMLIPDNNISFTGEGSNITENSFYDITEFFINGDENVIGENVFNRGQSLIINGMGNNISNNVFDTFSDCIQVGQRSDSYNNVIYMNDMKNIKNGLIIHEYADQTHISENNITGKSVGSDYGIRILSDDNTVNGNMISDFIYGLFVLEGSANLTGTDCFDNDYGIYSRMMSSSHIKDCLIENNSVTDINLVSSYLENTNSNYSSMYKNWTLTVEAFDSNNTRINFTASIDSNSTDFYLLNDSVSGEMISFIIPEFYEDKDEDIIILYNPYKLTLRNTQLGAVNETFFNITSDMHFDIIFNGTLNQTIDDGDDNETGNETTVDSFSLRIESPGNETYNRNDLINGNIILEVISSAELDECVYVLNGDDENDMEKSGLKSFRSSVSGSDFTSGVMNSLYFKCTENGGLENRTETIYFTIYPDKECDEHDDCLGSQYCYEDECINLECDCGYADEHECVYYECCDFTECADDEQCSNHECVSIQCECPERIRNHKCDITSGYCCNDNMCTRRSQTQVCDLNLHKCIERVLKISLSIDDINLGEEITVTVKDSQGSLVEGVEITANFRSGNKITATTDSSGTATIKPEEPGPVTIIARKSGYAAATTDAEVKEGFNILIVLVLIIIVVAVAAAFLFLKSRGGGSDPIILKKIIQGQNVTLSIKNNTKESLSDVIVSDQVPKGAFISSNIKPEVDEFDANTDNLQWKFMTMQPSQEINITYETYKSMQGFSVKVGDDEFIADSE